MDIQRLIQFFALGFILLLIWSAWESDYGQQRIADNLPTELNEQELDRADTVPDLFVPGDLATEGPDLVEETAREQIDDGHFQRDRDDLIRVQTDLLDVLINTRGGEIQQVDLLEYGVSSRDPTPLRLMSSNPSQLFIARSGIITDDPGRGPGVEGMYRIDNT